MLSPAQAPAAAQRMTSGSDSLPLAATTPAVMTVASLGTTGISASSIANSMTTPYAHQDASDTSWVSWSNIAVRHPPFARTPPPPPLRPRSAPASLRDSSSALRRRAGRRVSGGGDDVDVCAEPYGADRQT